VSDRLIRGLKNGVYEGTLPDGSKVPFAGLSGRERLTHELAMAGYKPDGDWVGDERAWVRNPLLTEAARMRTGLARAEERWQHIQAAESASRSLHRTPRPTIYDIVEQGGTWTPKPAPPLTDEQQAAQDEGVRQARMRAGVYGRADNEPAPGPLPR